MKELFLRALLLVLSVLVCLFLLEGLTFVLNGALDFKHGHVSPGIGGKSALEYPILFIKDPVLFWKMAPRKQDINSQGFRDREFSPEKEEGVYRIICMGDSITFGWPTEIDDTYPNTLERLLAERFPEKRFEVINAGVPGYTTFQGLLLLENKIVGYDPDLLIIYYGVNDRERAYRQDKDIPRPLPWIANLENFLSRFSFYKLFNRMALRLRYPPGNVMVFSRVSPYNYQRNLKKMEALASERGIHTLFVVHPAFYDPREKTVFTDARYVAPRSLRQFDIAAFFKSMEEKAPTLFLDDIRPHNFHLTSDGQRILAEGIFEFLVKNPFFLHAKPPGGTTKP